ncbi:MAG: ATP synthase F1 subunit delta [Dehalococcoidales bacterium]|nr:ATP synthase F1 subunit delta [Dehalococcoidales bacterium]MCX6011336.1 ATP synthase F1 subunit delta [Chloroflexota bacterium]
MAKRVYARRYARAVFEIALERKELDRWQADLEKIAVLGEDDAFMELVENPKVSFEKKAEILTKLLGDVNPLARNLVYLLVSRRRFGMVGDIAEDYHRLLDDYRGIEHAEVVTAVPLDAEEKKRLEEHLGKVVGKKIVLESSVDPSLVGGMIARVGGKLLDGSTHSQLLALKKELATGGLK